MSIKRKVAAWGLVVTAAAQVSFLTASQLLAGGHAHLLRLQASQAAPASS